MSSLIRLSDTKQKAGQFRLVTCFSSFKFLRFISIFSLRDGRQIRTVSALLLQLVQTSAHDVHLEARRIEKARKDQFAMKQGSFSDFGSVSDLNTKKEDDFLDDLDRDV